MCVKSVVASLRSIQLANINFLKPTTLLQKESFFSILNLYPKAKNIIKQLEYIEVVFTDKKIESDNGKWFGVFSDYDYKDVIKVYDNGNSEQLTLTLLHELHHLVQKYTGVNMNNSLPYNERQHEIEANEVSQRIYGSWLIMNRITDNG